jgi:uncharacterized protein
MMEKNKIFEVLNDWNFWDKPVSVYVDRPHYQSRIELFSRSGEVIVLKGVRRSGKSTLLVNHIRNLVTSDISPAEILFVNFEDPRFTDELNAGFLDQVLDVYKEFINSETKPHIFLDEVQNVFQWEKWVRTGYELGRGRFYVTGSSSKLLSKEFGTTLSGRNLSIEVLPLGFKEFLLFKGYPMPNKQNLITKRLTFKKEFNEYIKDGGFPKLLSLENELKKPEVIMYFETIILKDIVARYNLKNYDNVKKVALYLLSNIGKPFNLNKIKLALNISYELIDKYYEYLKDTYLLFELRQFEYSLQKQFSGKRKVYCIDNGILTHISFRISDDYGRYLKNLVLIELLRRNEDIYFYSGKRECDFLIKDGEKISQAIQVSRSLENEETKSREINGLLEAMETFGLQEGLILTEDEEDALEIGNHKVTVLPVWKWVLM